MQTRQLSALFIFSLLLPSVCSSQTPPDEAELKRLQTSITEVKANLAAARDQRSSVASELQQSEQAIVQVQKAIRSLDNSIQASSTELQTLQEQAKALELQRKEQQALIGDYLLNARIAGADTSLKLLLNQDDPKLGSRMLQYYQYIGKARSQRVNAYRQTLQTLNEVSTDIMDKADKLRGEQLNLSQEESTLNQNHNARQGLLAKLDESMSSQQNKLNNLELQRTEIEQVLQALRTSISELNLGDSDIPFAQRKGQLPWPVSGRVINSYGTKHALGDLTWEGMMLEASEGADIQAIHHGRVLFADWLGSSGLLLIIDHGDGYMSLYAHNQQLYKTVGDWVSSGEIIAAAGNTGGQRDYGLYFEIRRNGKAENPVNWCAARR